MTEQQLRIEVAEKLVSTEERLFKVLAELAEARKNLSIQSETITALKEEQRQRQDYYVRTSPQSIPLKVKDIYLMLEKETGEVRRRVLNAVLALYGAYKLIDVTIGETNAEN